MEVPSFAEGFFPLNEITVQQVTPSSFLIPYKILQMLVIGGYVQVYSY